MIEMLTEPVLFDTATIPEIITVVLLLLLWRNINTLQNKVNRKSCLDLVTKHNDLSPEKATEIAEKYFSFINKKKAA